MHFRPMANPHTPAWMVLMMSPATPCHAWVSWTPRVLGETRNGQLWHMCCTYANLRSTHCLDTTESTHIATCWHILFQALLTFQHYHTHSFYGAVLRRCLSLAEELAKSRRELESVNGQLQCAAKQKFMLQEKLCHYEVAIKVHHMLKCYEYNPASHHFACKNHTTIIILIFTVINFNCCLNIQEDIGILIQKGLSCKLT